MLVTMNEVLQYVEERRCAVGAFGTPNLEFLMASIRAAEERNESVIIQHTQLHECKMPIAIIGPIMVQMAKAASAPVCVMLDHGEDMDYVKTALELGFSTMVYNGSSKSYEDNAAMTREVVALVRTYGVSVEAEIGIIARHEGKELHIKEEANTCTDPKPAARFVKETGIGALAALVETVHGLYASQPKLDFGRIKKTKELTDIPLVVHGDSGISVGDIQKAIRCGIRKINYFFYMSNAGVKAVKELLTTREVRYFHDFINAIVAAMEEDACRVMEMLPLK